MSTIFDVFTQFSENSPNKLVVIIKPGGSFNQTYHIFHELVITNTIKDANDQYAVE